MTAAAPDPGAWHSEQRAKLADTIITHTNSDTWGPGGITPEDFYARALRSIGLGEAVDLPDPLQHAEALYALISDLQGNEKLPLA